MNTGDLVYFDHRNNGAGQCANTPGRGTYVVEDEMQIDDITLFRFWSKIDTSTTPDGCWLWTGWKDHDGYGRIVIANRVHSAHRLAWELAHGPIPPTMCICHHCDIRLCCRPDHLFSGTIADNTHDMYAKGRAIQPDLAGERNGRAKLTEADVYAIRAQYDAGCVRQSILAASYGVAYSTITDIVHRKSWKHLGGAA